MILAAARSAELPAVEHLTYLNTGSAGPLLRSVAEAMTAALTRELSEGRASESAWELFLNSRTAVRAAVGSLVGAAADEVMLAHHTTEGLNTALWGLDWQVGDRLLVTSIEHDAGLAAAGSLARRHGLCLDVVDVGDGAPAGCRAALDAALSGSGARALLVSHVAWSTGAVLPIADLAERAHRDGCAVIVDGAQAVGVVEVDVAALGVDAYAFNGYKWLCGPEGTGALVVPRDRQELIQQSAGGAFGVDPAQFDRTRPELRAPASGAARYETGSTFRPHLDGLLATCRHALDLGLADTARHIAATVAYAVKRLEAAGAIVHTPADARSGLLVFSLPGSDPAQTVRALESHDIIVRRIPGTDRLRISCAWFVTTEDIDVLLDHLHQI